MNSRGFEIHPHEFSSDPPFHKAPRIQSVNELWGPCEKDGAQDSNVTAARISNPLEFIYVVDFLGLVKRRVRAELMGMDFKSPRVHLRCELLGPCEEVGLA